MLAQLHTTQLHDPMTDSIGVPILYMNPYRFQYRQHPWYFSTLKAPLEFDSYGGRSGWKYTTTSTSGSSASSFIPASHTKLFKYDQETHAFSFFFWYYKTASVNSNLLTLACAPGLVDSQKWGSMAVNIMLLFQQRSNTLYVEVYESGTRRGTWQSASLTGTGWRLCGLKRDIAGSRVYLWHGSSQEYKDNWTLTNVDFSKITPWQIRLPHFWSTRQAIGPVRLYNKLVTLADSQSLAENDAW